MTELLLTIRRGADFDGQFATVAHWQNLTILQLANGDELWFDTAELHEASREGAASQSPALSEPLPDVAFLDRVSRQRRRRR